MAEIKDEFIEVIPHVEDLYQKWFLDYASYVVLERAIPTMNDGLKPVQRRILHAMKEQDDGRFTKVANLIGQTMQYHPHGDASIGEALVNIGQKNLLIETQGNWGDVNTGDSAAAPRYIEARLSKFALFACFHEQNTNWQMSYDGRKREPISLPIKFPLILSEGVEGIAVGMSTKILPHNFIELCEASIKIIKKQPFEIYPDFLQGGIIDVSNYNNGLRGSKIKCRAKIEKIDSKYIKITSVPFGINTGKLIESILDENQKGRIKIKKIIDNTTSSVDILIELLPGIPIDHVIDSLYAYTLCENSISPLSCCIIDNKPEFLGVDTILKLSTLNTKDLLTKELQIKKNDFENKWHFLNLEKIFFENKIYKVLENNTLSWEEVIKNIKTAFIPFLKEFKNDISLEDYEKLTEKPVKRIYKLDIEDLKNKILKYEDEIKLLESQLNNIDKFTIEYFKTLIQKFGKDKERKTEIKSFEKIEIKQIAINNTKLYANLNDGFIGTSLKKELFITDCNDNDDIIIIRKDGIMSISKITDKKYVGKDIIYCGVWNKEDLRHVFNIIYINPKVNKNFVKRFQVSSITRDKEYILTGEQNCKIIYFSSNPNAEVEIVTIKLSQSCKAKIKVFDFDFDSVLIKGRNSIGNIISTYPIHNITLKKKGKSTLGGIKLWLNKENGRINKNNEGILLGEFSNDDKIIVFKIDGSYTLSTFEDLLKIDINTTILVDKFNENSIVNCIYFDGNSKNYYIKRFLVEQKAINKDYFFISEDKNSKLIHLSTSENEIVKFNIEKGKNKTIENCSIDIDSFVSVKGWKSLGNRLSQYNIINKFEIISLQKNNNDTIIDEDLAKQESELIDTKSTNSVVQGELF